MKTFVKNIGWVLLTLVLITGAVGTTRAVQHKVALMRRYRPPTAASAVSKWAVYSAKGLKRGPEDAAVRLVLFTDYRCPWCQQLIPVMDSVLELHPDVHLVERMFPQDGYVGGADLPQAAYCASQKGQLVEFRKGILRSELELEDDRWGAVAIKSGISDTAGLKACVASGMFASAVHDDEAAGSAIGVVYPPALLVNDSLYLMPPITVSSLDLKIRAVKSRAWPR